MVVADVTLGGPVRVDDPVVEQPSPLVVTVTVTTPTLTVETTVVVAQEVTVDAGHWESVVEERVAEPEVEVEVLVLVLVLVLESVAVVEEVVEEAGGPVVVVDWVVEEVVVGTPHSSRDWPWCVLV